MHYTPVTDMSVFLTVSWVGLQCVIVAFPDQTHELSTLDNFRSGSVFGIYFGIHYFVFFLVLPSSEKWLMCFNCLPVFCDCLCTVALLHVVMGWPLVFDCGIS